MSEIGEILARDYGERHALHLTYVAYVVAALLFAILVAMSRSIA
jgi:hypothetical protein